MMWRVPTVLRVGSLRPLGPSNAHKSPSPFPLLDDPIPARCSDRRSLPIEREREMPWPRAAMARATGEVMEPAIWGQLPDELLDRILALLPLRALLSLRPTCRRFHSLLLSPSFLSLLPSSQPSSFLLLSHPQFSPCLLPVYDSLSDSWRSLALPHSSLLSSSSGLLLLSPHSPSSSHLLISNPLTNSSKLLSSPAHPILSATLISVPSSSPHGYKIFLPSSSSNWVFLYDSTSSSWAKFPGFEPILARANSHQDGVFYQGSIYFSTQEPFSMVSFDLNSGSWETVPAAVPRELVFVRLVGDGGKRLFLVGGVGSDGISRSLRVWEMIRGGWEQVGWLPDMMCRKFVSVCYHNYAHVHCLWHNGLVCVCCTTWPEVLFFRVARGTWHWLPKCPLLQEKWSCGFRWFSFVPDLYALV